MHSPLLLISSKVLIPYNSSADLAFKGKEHVKPGDIDVEKRAIRKPPI